MGYIAESQAGIGKQASNRVGRKCRVVLYAITQPLLGNGSNQYSIHHKAGC